MCPGYQTLAVDLHTHSVFSDGMVWPDIRVQESDRDGLALMAVTEHLEYQPRAEDIPHPDRNRSFVLARDHARSQGSDLIVVNGAEITRDLGFDWSPRAASPETDPRSAITLRHVLNMSSGLYPVDNAKLEYATGSGLAYWAGASSTHGARNRGLIREPGTSWDYENYDYVARRVCQ